jgi:NTF2-related export protein 1/2
MSGLYSDTSLVIWNGNTQSGAANIMNFYQSLPGTVHRVQSLDCQPILSSVSTILITCMGMVKFDGEAAEKRFSQDFLLNKEGEVWKVGSDCFRFLDRL